MSASVNKVIIVGNLGKDPEVRTTEHNQKVISLSVATNESWIDKTTGLKKERTEWHRVTIFNSKIAEIAAKYLKKGVKVYIEGQLQTRKWVVGKGMEHIATEIVLPAYRGELTILSKTTVDLVGGEDLPNKEQTELYYTEFDPF